MPDHPPLTTRIETLRLGDLELLDVNARFMRHETFQTLVQNVKADGTLTSVPFAWRKSKKGKYVVLSGNHRVKAAIEAFGPDYEAPVMVTEDKMPKDRRVALQLAHNAIAGEDDPAVLRDLYEGMDEIDWRVYSGLDDKTLELLEQVDVGSLSEANLTFQTIAIAFLPTESDRARDAFAAARAELPSGAKTWLAKADDEVRAFDAIEAAGKSHGISNVATSLMLILDVFERHIRDLREGFIRDGEAVESKRWVPVASITGHNMPAGAAATLDRAVSRMMERDEAGEPWQALELLAADYLAGP